jgi:hypothetical protein
MRKFLFVVRQCLMGFGFLWQPCVFNNWFRSLAYMEANSSQDRTLQIFSYD